VTTSTPGFTAAVYAADDVPDSLDGWTKVSSDLRIAAEQEIPLDTGGQSFRYYLLWIGELPEDGKATVKELTVLK
jgi:serine/threonine-protein kinase